MDDDRKQSGGKDRNAIQGKAKPIRGAQAKALPEVFNAIVRKAA